ncbi:MAG TPA: ribonuclease HIII, partial [Candidatus Dojkabacteria bacterium]|nr:ribonuclease HIII [Candidatus Dojkabacteria bacterium]
NKSNMQTETIKIQKDEFEKYDQFLLDQGFGAVSDPNPYMFGKYKKDGTYISIYTSGKVVVQGLNISSIVQSLNGFNGLGGVGVQGGGIDESFIPHIGADEVGKGDFFGPLIVCAAYVSTENLSLLKGLGVTDSKKISDKRIAEIYNQIQEKILYRVWTLNPVEYNERILKAKNIALVLAELHGDNIKEFVRELSNRGIEYNKIVIDQFSSNKGRLAKHLSQYNMEQFHQAESKDITVAMASIIARYYFIQAMKTMSEKYDMVFPYGATHVIDAGKEFLKTYGEKELVNVAKLNFKTVSQL